jgi:hypothetical protein
MDIECPFPNVTGIARSFAFVVSDIDGPLFWAALGHNSRRRPIAVGEAVAAYR